MSWAKENKFLTGYCIVMALGAGALGYQVFTASGAYDDANTKYKTKAQAYGNLRHVAPYPNRDNLAKLEEQKKEAEEVIRAFQADLAKREFPLEPMSSADFQEMLRKTVIAVKSKADAAGVALGKDAKEKFYLGFQRYEGAPPDPVAAAALGRDLKAVEWVVEQLIATPVISIKEIKRADIPEEKKSTPPPKQAPGPANKAGVPSKANLVSAHTFDIIFTCRQPQLAKALNTIISPSAPQFYIPRNVRVLNSNPKAPSKVSLGAGLAAANTAPATPDPGAPAGQATPAPAVAAATPSQTLTYLVGEETIEATVRLDIVDFAQPAPATAAAATPAPAR